MRIAVVTFGSEGDVRPFVALAKGLRRAGEDAYLVAPGMFETRAREHEVPFVDSGARMDQAWSEANGWLVLAETHPLEQAKLIWQMFKTEMLRVVDRMPLVLRGADLVVHHGFDVTAYGTAMAMRLPRISVALFHTMLKNELQFGGFSLGRPMNRALARFMRAMFTKATQPAFTEVMKATGVEAPPRALLDSNEGAARVLLPVSPSFVPRDPGWGEKVIQTGYWFLDYPEFVPPASLQEFMAERPPPVVITFGSMVGMDAGQRTQMLLEALERAGQRGILQAGWAGLGGEVPLPKTVLRVDHVPHDWLFPRAACVVHHGGAGTTGAALRAGVPQIPMWHLGDQQMWSALLWKQGVTPGFPRNHQRVTAKMLAASIQRAISRPEIRKCAEAVGKRIRAEDGVGAAVAAIRARASISGSAGRSRSAPRR